MAARDPQPWVNHTPTRPCDSLTLPAPITLRPDATWPQNSGIPHGSVCQLCAAGNHLSCYALESGRENVLTSAGRAQGRASVTAVTAVVQQTDAEQSTSRTREGTAAGRSMRHSKCESCKKSCLPACLHRKAHNQPERNRLAIELLWRNGTADAWRRL
uniref:Uncharacterized protein n=1 Tax=Gallus gallus TaxID=9031 RepID=A0A8V0X6M1_CHICK